MTGRLFPQIMAKWRYPFVRRETNGSQLVEPVAALVLAPNGGNPDKIPNEDSQDFEFDDTNLFSPSRFTGVDRVDGGQRFIYGINWGLYGDRGGAIEAFLGQSYRFASTSQFSSGSGLSDQVSDLVGRIRVSPGNYLDLVYRFRLDQDDFKAKRSELRLTAGPSWLRGNVNYFFISKDAGDTEFTEDREEISVNLKAMLTKYWSAEANWREDLGPDGGTISERAAVTYEDECFTFIVSFERKFTEDRDLEPRDTLLFQLIFKHLGTFKTTG